MKRIFNWMLAVVILATVSALPACAQSYDSTVVHCRGCIPVTVKVTDSIATPDTTWRMISRDSIVGYRDSVEVICRQCVAVTVPVADSSYDSVTVTWTRTTRDSITGYRDSVEVIVVTPIPVANEPYGGTVITDNNWVGVSPTVPAVNAYIGKWLRYAIGNTGRSVFDATAPLDPNVLEITKTGTQGTGPEHFSVTIPKGNSRLYIRVPIFVPVNYKGSSSGVQKLFHIWAPIDNSTNLMTGGSLVVPAIYGVDTKALSAQIRIQNATITSTQLISFNINGPTIQRGTWYIYEYLIKFNTGVQANGEAHMWINGKKYITRTNIVYSNASRPKNWTVIQLNPTYGGSGTTPDTVQKIRYGKVRVVVAP